MKLQGELATYACGTCKVGVRRGTAPAAGLERSIADASVLAHVVASVSYDEQYCAQKQRLPMPDSLCRPLRLFVLVVVLVSAAGCKAQRSGEAEKVVEHTIPVGAGDDFATLADTPDVDLIAGESDALNGAIQVTPVHRLADGSLVVWDYQNRQLRLISARGVLIAQSPGKGQGPGQFNTLDDYIVRRIAGDSLAVLERVAGRVSIFDERLHFVRRYELLDKESLFRIPLVSVIFDDGSVLISDLDSLPCRPGLSRYTAKWNRVPQRGSPVSYGDLFLSESFDKLNERKECYGQTLFRPKAAFAARGMELYYTEGSTFSVRKFDEHGGVKSVVEMAGAARPVTETDLLNSMAPDEDTSKHEKLLRELSPWPKVMPAIWSLQVDAIGLIWTGEYPQRDLTQSWRVFDSTGSYKGRVTSPARFQIVEIGMDYVLGHWRDEDDIEHVRVYSLNRLSRTAGRR